MRVDPTATTHPDSFEELRKWMAIVTAEDINQCDFWSTRWPGLPWSGAGYRLPGQGPRTGPGRVPKGATFPIAPLVTAQPRPPDAAMSPVLGAGEPTLKPCHPIDRHRPAFRALATSWWLLPHEAPGEDRPIVDIAGSTKHFDEPGRLVGVVKDKLITGHETGSVVRSSWDPQTGTSEHRMPPLRGREPSDPPQTSSQDRNAAVGYVALGTTDPTTQPLAFRT